MAIMISRDGELIGAPKLDEETRKKIRLAMVSAFLSMHPETITEAVEDYQRSQGLA